MAVRASSRPKKSSMKRRATWVDSTRSVGVWNVPTLSACEWRSAVADALGANGSCTCRMSSGRSASRCSIVRAPSSGSDTIPPRRAGGTGTLWPTAITRAEPSRKSESGLPAAARIRRRDSRTSVRELEGAITSTRWPRSASSWESRSTYSLTSRRDSQGKGVTCATVSGRPSFVTRATYTAPLLGGCFRLGVLGLAVALRLLQRRAPR